MGFELIIPKARAGAIGPGQASIDANGRLNVHATSTRAVRIDGEAAVLADHSTRRVAIRAARPNEPSAKVRMNKSRTVAQVGVAGALAAIGVTVDAAKGRYPVIQKDDMLIVQIGEATAAPAVGRPRKAS